MVHCHSASSRRLRETIIMDHPSNPVRNSRLSCLHGPWMIEARTCRVRIAAFCLAPTRRESTEEHSQALPLIEIPAVPAPNPLCYLRHPVYVQQFKSRRNPSMGTRRILWQKARMGCSFGKGLQVLEFKAREGRFQPTDGLNRTGGAE